MKTRRLGLGAIALVAVGALTLAGCSSSAEKPSSSSSSSAFITTNGSEPANPLIPTMTNEVGGGKITDSIFAGLVYYDAKGAAHNDVAESIETTDATNFTIKLREGLKFTNDEPVDSDSFINAWNYGAKLGNAQLSSYFFEDIEGFSYDEDTELTGLVKVSDTEFTVKLKQPTADFSQRLGYTAFSPLPASAFDDMKAFGENPIGNGPYKLDGADAWNKKVGIKLAKNDAYDGPRESKNAGLEIKFYASLDSAYADLQANNLDVIDAIPSAAMATYEADLGDRAVNQAAAINQTVTIPERLEHFAGEEGQLRRAAISMAINRDQITDKIFQGTRTPAVDFTSPVVDGFNDALPGNEVLAFNADEAKKKWAEADKISPWTGSFQIAYNADGDHSAWVDAVTNQISTNLGIEASGNPIPLFSELRASVVDQSIKTAFRTGWQADYPGLFNFLGPIFGTGAGSNDGKYSNAEFDGLLKEGQAQTDSTDANKKFSEAQEILLTDLPAIPLWYANVNGGYSENVENVEFGWNSVPLYYEITTK